MTGFDPLFVSHGSPMLALDPGAVGRFWVELGARLPRPSAVLCVSGHWTTTGPAVSAAAPPATIHDFYGFPEPLYRQKYVTPGAPDLARRVSALLAEAGIPHGIDPERGLDHGAWVPLRSFYPAGIPVVQLAVQPQRDARFHSRIGRALASLCDEDVLILASGGAVHNLREMDFSEGPPPAWARDFDDWLAATLAAGDEEAFLDWQHKAPQARRAHPTPEHFLPIFIAYGAAGARARGERLWQGFSNGTLSMAAFRFVGEA